LAILHGRTDDPLERLLFGRYFERLYAACDLDRKEIRKDLRISDPKTLAVNFRTAADRFRMIDDEDSASVVALYRGPDGTDEAIDMLLRTVRRDGPERWLMRKLQRYTVNVPRLQATRLQSQGDIEEVIPGLFVQAHDLLYHPVLGLLVDGSPTKAPLIV
jgi:CRISPR-associated endonuclease/helicase Cas3